MPERRPAASHPVAVLLDPAADRYGASRFTAALAQELARRGRPVEIWVPFDHGIGELIDEELVSLRIIALPVLRRGDWNRPGRALGALRSLTAQTAVLARAAWSVRGRVSVVHAVTLSSVAGLVIKWVARAPLHWSVHETVRSGPERRIFATLLRGADTLYACSAYVAEQFPGLRFTVAYTGTHLVDGPLPTPRRPMAGRDVPVILCVGRVNRWKGQDLLVEALTALQREGREFRCRLVGGAFPGEEHLVDELRERAARAGMLDRIEFIGEVDDPAELFASADLVVVPSKVPEPFGKVVVEAMALGRPVIATTPGGPAEVIRSGVDGLLVPAGDLVSLTAALRQLLSDPGYAARLGESAAQRAREFSERATVSRIAAATP